MEKVLHIYFLGELRLALGDEPLPPLSSDRVQALLAYLLLNGGAAIPRLQIAAALWPESGEGQARSNLRTLVYQLRRALPQAERFLVADNATLGWQGEGAYWLDVAAFEQMLVQALAAEREEDDPQAIRLLERAAALYTGDLLPGLYEDWLAPRREELRQSYLDALGRLTGLLELTGEVRAGIRYTRRLLAADPLDEAAYVQLMRFHAQAGDRAGVRRAYDACVAALRAELDVEPAATTRRAYEELVRFQPQAPVRTRPPAPDASSTGQSAQPSSRDEGQSQVAQPVAPADEAAVEEGEENSEAGEGGEEAFAYPYMERASPRRANLPLPATPFVGRDEELAHLAQLLADPACRLLTLAGPGGVGKSRLALQCALGHVAVFAHGAAYTPLAPLADPALLPSAIAAALHAPLAPTASPEEQLVAYLAGKELLLVLDNFEHLMSASELLSGLLRHAPRLKLLVTSRERLNLQEEWVFDLQGLPTPEPEGTGGTPAHPDEAALPLEENPAVALFVQAARRAQAAFAPSMADLRHIARIARLTGGFPLALELAATWTRLLSPAEIEHELARSLDFLASASRSLPARHRSLRAVFDHSWALLDSVERTALARLSVFRGGFTRPAAQAVAQASLPILSSLLDKSLLRRTPDGRFDMHELVRQYAADRLSAQADQQDAQQAHAAYFTQFVTETDMRPPMHRTHEMMDRIAAEHNNVRAALTWAVEQGSDPQEGLALAGGMARFWYLREHWQEGANWLRAALAAAPEAQSAAGLRARAVATCGLGEIELFQGSYRTAWEHLQQAEELARRAGDRWYEAFVLFLRSQNASAFGDPESSFTLAERARDLFHAEGNSWGEAAALQQMGTEAIEQGDVARGAAICREALYLFQEMNARGGMAGMLHMLGWAAQMQGDLAQAEQYFRRSLQIFREDKLNNGAAWLLRRLGVLALLQGDPARAAARLQEAAALRWRVGSLDGLAWTLEPWAEVALAQGEPARAAWLLGAAAAVREAAGAPAMPAQAAEVERIAAAVREAVGEAAYAAAFSAAAALPVEEIAAGLRAEGG